ncbi:MAG: hypothetical protein FWE18_00345 [Alphaproteobacteria bacterium]|nr:hypothetical protein [Alphaproteobacteria bacterium]
MKIRFVFLAWLFLGIILVGFSFMPMPLKAANCNFSTGVFDDGCTASRWDSGNDSYNLPILQMTRASDMLFYNVQFLNPVNISVASNSRLAISARNTTATLNFTVVDSTARIDYGGGASGVVNVNLNSACYSVDCFRSNGNITNLNFQGSNGANGGWFTVGARNRTGGTPQSANIIVQNIAGNGSINLTNNSSLTIQNYGYDAASNTNAINFIRGVNGGQLIANSDIFINELNVSNAAFNGDITKILNISGSGNNGSIVFNGNADITSIANSDNILFNGDAAIEKIDDSGSITFNNGTSSTITNLNSLNNLTLNHSIVSVDNLVSLGDVNIGRDSTLNIANSNNGFINAVSGNGTLQVDSGSTTIHNINLNNLVFNDGDIILEKDWTGAPHIINNITRTGGVEDDTFSGGNLTQTEGTLIIRNIDWLNSLTIDGSESSHLALTNVNHIGSLNINNGGLYLVVSHDNNISTEGYSEVIHVDNATFNGGITTAMIRNTAELKVGELNEFLLINADNGITTTRAIDQSLFSTSLSNLWWNVEVVVNPNNPKQLLMQVERMKSLVVVLNEDLDVPNTLQVNDLAEYLDELIRRGIPLEIESYLEAYSNTPQELYDNLRSMIPLASDTYLKSAHYGLSSSLSISKVNALVEDKDVWALYYYSNGRFKNENEGSRDVSKANSMQFGYNFWSSANEDSQNKQSFGVIGGFSIGDTSNVNYRSDSLAFNAGGMYRYQIENNIFNISMMYGLSAFDTRRDYFISTNPVPDSLMYFGVDNSRLQSSLNTHEILLDAQYGYKLQIDALQGAALTPRVFITPSVLIINSYTEKGPYSNMEVKSQTTPIVESGAGFDLTKGFNVYNGSLDVSIGSDAFYRHYRIPAKRVAFAGSPFSATLGEKHGYDGFVITPKIAAGYTYKQSQFGIFYQRESAKEYFDSAVGASYKYSF